MVIMCNKEPAGEIQANLMMTVSALSASPKHYLNLVYAHLSLKSLCFRESHLHPLYTKCFLLLTYPNNTHLLLVTSGIQKVYFGCTKKSTYGGCAVQILSTERY